MKATDPFFSDEDFPGTEHRPWGFFTVLCEEAGVKIKRIGIRPDSALSLQYHRHRSEVWNVISGKGVVQIGEHSFAAKAGDRFEIAAHELHRASSEVGMTFIEVQRGDYLGEDDIVRLEDKYNRS